MTSGRPRIREWLVAAETRPVGEGSTVCLVEPSAEGVETLRTCSWSDWAGTVGSLFPHADSLFLIPEGSTARLPETFATLEGLHKAVTGDTRHPVTLWSSHDRTGGEAALWVPPSLAWFEGHFPGHPVVPGVVLIGWAIELIRPHLARDSSIGEFRQMKFQKVVVPYTTAQLRWQIERKVVSFELRSLSGTHSKAQLVLGACP